MSHCVAPISRESPGTSQGSDKSPHPDHPYLVYSGYIGNLGPKAHAIRCSLARFVAGSLSCESNRLRFVAV
jgi:hypothetical protein